MIEKEAFIAALLPICDTVCEYDRTRGNAPAAQGYHQKPSRAKEDSPLLVAGPPKYLTFIHTEFMV